MREQLWGRSADGGHRQWFNLWAHRSSGLFHLRAPIWMSDEALQIPSASRNRMDFIMASERYKRQRTEYPAFYDYFESSDCPEISNPGSAK